jgi:hypothetical protein
MLKRHKGLYLFALIVRFQLLNRFVKSTRLDIEDPNSITGIGCKHGDLGAQGASANYCQSFNLNGVTHPQSPPYPSLSSMEPVIHNHFTLKITVMMPQFNSSQQPSP